jgi:Arc/MetJ-type ribon-helix-helix transcriptional regulator
MPTTKIAITLDDRLLREVDRLVAEGRYPNRSQAIQAAVRENLERWQRQRLSAEAAKLDLHEERRLAEEALSAGNELWPEY